MTRECNNYKKDGKCKFGTRCKYKHVDKKAAGGKVFEQCLQFISKEGCKGNCFKAHVYPEDFELFDLYKAGVNIIHLRVCDLEMKKQSVAVAAEPTDSMDPEYYPPISQPPVTQPPVTQPPVTQRQPSHTVPEPSRVVSEHSRTVPEPSRVVPLLDPSRYSGPAALGTAHSVAPTSEASTLGVLEDDGFYLPEPVFESVMAPPPTTTQQRECYTLEVKQLERLYRDRCQMHATDKGTMFQLVMKPSDPDWSLTLLEINLDIFIPCHYPAVSCSIELCDGRISELTQGDINAAIKLELAERAGSLCIRPMLRWLDRNIEAMLQAEVQFHGFSNLRAYKKGEIEWSSEEESESDEEGEAGETSTATPTSDYLQTDQGTSIRLTSLDLHSTCDGVSPHNLLLLLTCLRCKFSSELLVSPDQPKSVDCGKCACVLSATIYKKLCNGANNVLACVDLVGCSLSDVIIAKSRFSIICTGCSGDNLANLYTGKENNSWCNECGNKIAVSFESVKLVVITPPTVSSKQKKVIKKEKGCVEGQPLPDRGICKHYKKSERWFRFSCCERLYPCDKCHDAAVPDCPLEQAHRMVCGLCSKEQAVRSQCKYCHSEISGNLKSTHWEGGKGCRNKLRMDARDDKKYKGSKLKTQCQKSKRVGKQRGQKKKKEDAGDGE